MVTLGKRYTPKEIERYVDSVSVDDIKRCAQTYLWDKDVGYSHHSSCLILSLHFTSNPQFALAAVSHYFG